jgi:hypothetical protein
MKNPFKSKVTLGIAIGAAVLAVVVAVLLIVFIPRHTEDTIMEVCVVGNTVYYPVGEGVTQIEGVPIAECPAGWQEKTWAKSSLPLSVAVVDHTGKALPPDHDAWRSVNQAIRDTNSQYGFQALTASADGHGIVTVSWGVPYEPTAGRKGTALGYVSHSYNRDGGRCDANGLCANVGIRDTTERTSYLILRHEFGHVFFLAHDDYESSVMYPETYDDTEDDQMTNLAANSQPDIEALQERYAR